MIFKDRNSSFRRFDKQQYSVYCSRQYLVKIVQGSKAIDETVPGGGISNMLIG